MKNQKNRTLVNNNMASKKAIVQKNGTTFSMAPKPENCVLRQMSPAEYLLQLDIAPQPLALDFEKYKDPLYARNICRIYVHVAEAALDSPFQIKKFYISHLEKALQKLKKEQFSSYQQICKVFSINLDKQKCTNPIINLDNDDYTPLTPLAGWGYAETFFSNSMEAIPKILKKTYAKSNMTETERIKLAYAFFAFVMGFNNMPYDQPTIELSLEETAKANASTLTTKDKQEVINHAVNNLMTGEATSKMDATQLNFVYENYFSKFEDGSIDLDLVKTFLYSIVGEEYRLQILDFVNLLTADERREFSENHVQHLSSILDMRMVKEKIFSRGPWASGLNCFLTNPDSKSLSAMQIACKKFEANDWQFGKNVQGYKTPKAIKLYATERETKAAGYMYAEKPMRLRISDLNELRMMHFFLLSKI